MELTQEQKREQIRLKIKDTLHCQIMKVGGVTALDILRMPHIRIRAAIELVEAGLQISFLGDPFQPAKSFVLDLSQTLESWDESTIDKLYELFYE